MANKYTIANKVFSGLINLLLVFISIIMMFGIYYIMQIKIEKKEYANMFGYTFFEVATGSMSPTIKVGDVVIVKITKNVNKNDVIVFKDENNFITHRLIETNQDELVTKGDANNSKDRKILKEQVLGQVIFIAPKVGIWKKVLLSPQILRFNINRNFIFRCIIYVFSKK